MQQAIQFMLISTLSFTIMNGMVKYLEPFTSFQLVFFRSVGSFVLCMLYLWYYRIPILGNQRKLLVTRGTVGMISMTLFFMALKEMPFGPVISLRYLSPFFATLFAIFLLKEKVYRLQWLFFLVAFAGVILLKGVDTNINVYGFTLSILAALFSGLVYIIIRKIGHRDHPVVIVNYFMFTAMIVGFVLSLSNWVPPVGIDWLWLLSLGIFGFGGQLFMTKAFQNAVTNKVAPFKYLEVIFALMIGSTFFGEHYSWWSLVGITLILIGLFLNVRYKKK